LAKSAPIVTILKVILVNTLTYASKNPGMKIANNQIKSLIGIIVIATRNIFQKFHLGASSLVLEWYN
jgi:hypothetical protein